MAVKVPVSSGKYWDLSAEGVEEITQLRKRLLNFCENVEKAKRNLMGAVVEYGEDLSVYRDGLENGLSELERLNAYCKESIELLEKRIAEYEQAVRKEMGLFSFMDFLDSMASKK